MSYYKVLGLEREPFSTSPDPDFFYQSGEHKTALTNIMIEIRLKRGLSVILGDIGTGKTTLSRKLFQLLSERQDISFYMILDPTFDNEWLFLSSLVTTLGMNIDPNGKNILELKSAIKDFLFQKGVYEKKTVVLLIDEAQKLNALSLEVLRMLLNYETNEFKLLQLVLLGQIELLPRLSDARNLMDRVSLMYSLGPFNLEETREMIHFRIRRAGHQSNEKLFKDDAIKEIHRCTDGYPRRIAMVCHQALKLLVMQNKPVVSHEIIREIIEHDERLRCQKSNLLLKNSY